MKKLVLLISGLLVTISSFALSPEIAPAEKSFMDDKVPFERPERVAITRGRGVLGNPEGFADLRESELIPDLHDQHLALFHGQEIDGHDPSGRSHLGAQDL